MSICSFMANMFIVKRHHIVKVPIYLCLKFSLHLLSHYCLKLIKVYMAIYTLNFMGCRHQYYIKALLFNCYPFSSIYWVKSFVTLRDFHNSYKKENDILTFIGYGIQFSLSVEYYL